MKIVIVEDEIRIREGLCRLLARIGDDYQVAAEAEDGEEGLRVIREHRPDLVITDIKMPVMDGLMMLTRLNEEKIFFKTIVLSAHSEFDYARQAIKLGVSEYLLKPLTVTDLAEAMKHMEEQLDGQEKKRPEALGNPAQVLTGIILGSLLPDQHLKHYLKAEYGIPGDQGLIQLAVYLGGGYEEKKDGIIRWIREICCLREAEGCQTVEISRDKTVLAVIYSREMIRDEKQTRRWLQNCILTRKDRGECSYSYILSRGLDSLRADYQLMFQSMDWNIILGDDVMVSWPKISQIQTKMCSYPLELENGVKIALCAREKERVEQYFERFSRYFQDGNVYNPREIKECYVRFVCSVISISKETGIIDYQNIEQQRLLQDIMTARSAGELTGVLRELRDKIDVEALCGDSDLSLPVKRARSMVHEFYQNGITLEEIAGRLNLTPEYLGSQFHKEIGEPFSTYIKNFRIKKAKELLLGTQLKLYEISEQVGYSDAKYFSRVFKKASGQLPAEYRKTNK